MSPSKHLWKKAAQVLPLLTQSASKCALPSINLGWRSLEKKEHRNEDWFEENRQVMIPAVEAKRAAPLVHDNNPCLATRDALRAACSKCQRTA